MFCRNTMIQQSWNSGTEEVVIVLNLVWYWTVRLILSVHLETVLTVEIFCTARLNVWAKHPRIYHNVVWGSACEAVLSLKPYIILVFIASLKCPPGSFLIYFPLSHHLVVTCFPPSVPLKSFSSRLCLSPPSPDVRSAPSTASRKQASDPLSLNGWASPFPSLLGSIALTGDHTAHHERPTVPASMGLNALRVSEGWGVIGRACGP